MEGRPFRASLSKAVGPEALGGAPKTSIASPLASYVAQQDCAPKSAVRDELAIRRRAATGSVVTRRV